MIGLTLATATKPEKTTAPGRTAPVTGRILIVDDNQNTRMFLKLLLERAGNQVSSATNGKEALELLAPQQRDGRTEGDPEEPFDLLLCDWAMPEMDGLELVRQIRAQAAWRALYVIMLTANAGVNDVVAGLEVGADEYLVKPFNPEELLARVKAGLRIRHLQRELAQLQHQMATLHMATTASHEINNPLTILLGNLELLERRLKGLEDPEIRKRLDAIYKAAERIRQVAASFHGLRQVKLATYISGVQMLDLSPASAPAPAPDA